MASKARDLSNFISTAAIDASEIGTGAITTDKIADTTITHAKLHTTMDLSGKTVTLPTINALDVTNNINVGGTVDGVDIQALNTTAGDALPKAGGAMTGGITSTSDITVGNAYISSGYSQFANLRVPNNGYIGTPTTVNALQIQSNGNIALTGTVTATSFTGSGAALTGVRDTTGGRKNWIINGDFQISQRGAYSSATSITSSSVYYLDRFKSKYNNISGTTVRQTNQTVNGKVTNTMMLTATAGSNGRVESLQMIEDEVFNGQTVTVSAWVISNSASARLIIHQNGANIQTSSNAHTGGGAYELLKATVTCASNAGQLHIYTGIQAAATGNVSIANGDYFKMGFLQLELGSVATDFEHRSYGEELALCQRYFYNPLYNLGGSRGSFNIDYLVSSGNNGWISFTVPFPVSMRANSTFSHSLTPAKFLGSAAPADGADKFSFYIQNQGYAGLAGNGSIANLSGGGMTHGIVGTYYVSPSSTSASHIFIGNGCTFQFDAEL